MKLSGMVLSIFIFGVLENRREDQEKNGEERRWVVQIYIVLTRAGNLAQPLKGPGGPSGLGS